MRLFRRIAAYLCFILLLFSLPAHATADLDEHLHFDIPYLYGYTDKPLDIPEPLCKKGSGEPEALTDTQKEHLDYRWEYEGEPIEGDPREPGRYTLYAHCQVDGKPIAVFTALPVVLLPAASTPLEIENEALRNHLVPLLDKDADQQLSVSEAALYEETLDFSEMNLEALPEDFFLAFPSIKGLILDGNSFTQLPKNMDCLLALSELSMKNMPLERIDEPLPPGLKTLSMDHCALDLSLGTPEELLIAQLKSADVSVSADEQVPRVVYRPVDLETITLEVGERYQDKGFSWQTVRGTPMPAPDTEAPIIETLIVNPEGETEALRYDRLVFDEPGIYKICYTLDGTDVGIRELHVEGLPVRPETTPAESLPTEEAAVEEDKPPLDSNNLPTLALVLGLTWLAITLFSVLYARIRSKNHENSFIRDLKRWAKKHSRFE